MSRSELVTRTIVRDAALAELLAAGVVARLPTPERKPMSLPWLAILLCPLIWRRIMAKLELHDRSQLVTFAYEARLVRPS